MGPSQYLLKVRRGTGEKPRSRMIVRPEKDLKEICHVLKEYKNILIIEYFTIKVFNMHVINH